MPQPVRVGLVGAGTIAAQYITGLRASAGFDPVAICSGTGASAHALGASMGLRACSLAEMLGDPAIDYVLNLTPAHAHERITRACLEAGKSVYSEKPLAGSTAGADALIESAATRGLLLACAPATFLWPPLATVRRLIEEGALGRIAGALTVLAYPGPEIFHPNPAHFYDAAAGPLLDMGVYQVTALLALLGPVRSVFAFASTADRQRTIRVGPKAGITFPVEAPTHIHTQMQHSGGAISTVIVSFDTICAGGPLFEIFGERAGLSLSSFHSPTSQVWLKRSGSERELIALDGPWSDAQWAIGPTSAWRQWKESLPVLTSAARARAVLEVLLAVDASTAKSQAQSVPPSSAW